MDVEIVGLKEVQKYLKTLNTPLKQKALVKITDKVYNYSKESMKNHIVTGKMEHNLTKRVSKKNLTAYVRFKDDGMLVDWKGQKVNYAIFVLFPTKKHIISPKNKKALRWATDGKSYPSDERGDFFRFAKKVHHPGYKGDPILVNASNKMLKNDFKNIIDKLVWE